MKKIEQQNWIIVKSSDGEINIIASKGDLQYKIGDAYEGSKYLFTREVKVSGIVVATKTLDWDYGAKHGMRSTNEQLSPDYMKFYKLYLQQYGQ